MSEFEAYPKTPRLKGVNMTITEKIDGTNSQILIKDGVIKIVGSRRRQIKPNSNGEKTDNFGFAGWVQNNLDGLIAFLGDGRHFGEWAGPGIEKNSLGLSEKTFFVFNTHRHTVEKFASLGHLVSNLSAVPVLFEGPFDIDKIYGVHAELMMYGTQVKGVTDPKPPEGIIVSAFGTKFKRTEDDRPKGERE